MIHFSNSPLKIWNIISHLQFKSSLGPWLITTFVLAQQHMGFRDQITSEKGQRTGEKLSKLQGLEPPYIILKYVLLITKVILKLIGVPCWLKQ